MSVVRHINNNSNDDWKVRIEGEVKFRSHDSTDIVIHPREFAQMEFYTRSEVYGTVPYLLFLKFDVKGKGTIFLDNGRVSRKLEFGVGGPKRSTQAIFYEVKKGKQAKLGEAKLGEFRPDGIAVNRMGGDSGPPNGKEVLGDITLIN